jgi:CRP/FNR family transcriptional regulator
MRTITETDKEFICELSAPCFKILAPDEIDIVKASKTQVQFRKGDMLTKQGTFASYVLFLVTGVARQYIESDINKSFNLRINQPGEFIGLNAVFASNKFSYSSLALTDCHAFLIEKEAIATIIQNNGMFGMGIISRYSEQNANLYDTLRKVLYKQMNGRLADAMLYINSFKTNYPDIFQLLTRRDLADFAGISMESAVKLLKALEKEGVVKLSGKDIDVLDEAKLEKISRLG